MWRLQGRDPAVEREVWETGDLGGCVLFFSPQHCVGVIWWLCGACAPCDLFVAQVSGVAGCGATCDGPVMPSRSGNACRGTRGVYLYFFYFFFCRPGFFFLGHGFAASLASRQRVPPPFLGRLSCLRFCPGVVCTRPCLVCVTVARPKSAHKLGQPTKTKTKINMVFLLLFAPYEALALVCWKSSCVPPFSMASPYLLMILCNPWVFFYF